MPIGYSVSSVRVGAADVLNDGIAVAGSDIADIVITVAAPRELPHLRGRVTGASGSPGGQVELTGPIVGTLRAAIQGDGSFEFPGVPPGLYRIVLPQSPDIAPAQVVVDRSGADVTLGPTPAR